MRLVRFLALVIIGAFVLSAPSTAFAKPKTKAQHRAELNELVAVMATTSLPKGLHPADVKELRAVARLLEANKTQAALKRFDNALKRNGRRLTRAAQKTGDPMVLSRWVVRQGLANASSPVWSRVDKIRFYREQSRRLRQNAMALRRAEAMALSGRVPRPIKKLRAAPYRFGATAVAVSAPVASNAASYARAADEAEIEQQRALKTQESVEQIAEGAKEGASAAKELWELALKIMREYADRQTQNIQAVPRN